MTREEQRLESLAIGGDTDAFGKIIRTFDQQLRGLVWSIVGRQLRVDDVMQAAYEKAFKALPSFEQRSSMKSWLHTICYRTAIDQLRYEKQRRHEDLDSMRHAASSLSTSEAALTSIELDRIFSDLSPDHRILIMLTAGLGFTVDETAEILGLNRGTTASRLSRAKTKLREGKLI